MYKEAGRGFYLGRRFDPKQLNLPSEEMMLGSSFYISPYELLTHSIILGMTGSGKTVLGKIMIEEAALQGIPSILIDPKGDLSSLKLVFPYLKSDDFSHWIETRNEKNEEQAIRLSELYEKKLNDFLIPRERLARFNRRTKIVVLTPRSTTGIPLAISSLPSPPSNIKVLLEIEPEVVLDLIDTVVRTLIIRLFPRELPEKHRTEEKFLNGIIRYAWENRISLEGIDGLISLIDLVENPPIKKIGVMDVNSYISERDRHELAKNINNLLVGVEQLWHIGIPLDIELILNIFSRDGKTPIVIFNLSEIPSFEDRTFVVSRIAYAVYEWMRRKGGSGDPKLIFYIDEIGGGGGKTAFFPIHPYNPTSKPPLMLLIKQSRAFGVCCVFSTQNPGDIDYKGLSNCGTWIIGKLSTSRDREKFLQGLGDAEVGSTVNRRTLENQIAMLETGEFICKTKQGDIEFFKERWLMSYHKTLTSKEIREITDEEDRGISTISLTPAKSAYLELEHPVSIGEIQRHFERNIDFHVEKAECNYAPLLFFNIKTNYKKRHPFLSNEFDVHLSYGPFLVPLFKDEVDPHYSLEILGLERNLVDVLVEKIKDAPTMSKKISIRDVFSDFSQKMKGEIVEEITDNLNEQIRIEKERKKKAEKLEFKPKLDQIDFEIQKINDLIADLKGQISQLKEELVNLQRDKIQRLNLGEPVLMISKSIASRQRKINKSNSRISRLQGRILTYNSQKRRTLDSQNRKIDLIEEQFDSVQRDITRNIIPKLDFEDTVEVLLPICNADIRVKVHENSKVIKLEWNGYNGVRISSFPCKECGTNVDRHTSLNVCHICMEFLCGEHVQICAECGKTTCREHSWRCDCRQLHCILEEQKNCQECGSLLCIECEHVCEICGSSLCSNHTHTCEICGKKVCKEHLFICTICGKTLCSQEKINICSVDSHILCEECRIVCDQCGENICENHSVKCQKCDRVLCEKEDHYTTCVVCDSIVCNSCLIKCQGCGKHLCIEHYISCPNCNKTVCESCIRIESKFFGLLKRQKCILCI